ncbi:response regulator transcription factor [soil metagenome]
MELIQVLLVDDHPLFRDGFVAAVRQKMPHVFFTCAGTAAEARSMAVPLAPDLVLADWRLPDGDGLSLLTGIGLLCAASARVLLSGADDSRLPQKARAAGLIGYIPKTLEPAMLIHAMELILAGEPFFPDNAHVRASSVLTARQQDIVTLVARGLSNKEIGRALNITERTVKDHVSLIFGRLGAVNRADAIARASARGLL